MGVSDPWAPTALLAIVRKAWFVPDKKTRGWVEALGNQTIHASSTLVPLPAPSPWPNANARLLGLGVGLPVDPLDRLAQFSAKDFERFTLEWAEDFLRTKIPGVVEVQQRGGSGDKGRDIVVWIHPPTETTKHSVVYQCKHYAAALGAGVAAGEIAKVLHYTFANEMTAPRGYWFVTHKGVTGPLQDLIDDSASLKSFVMDKWDEHCADAVSSKFSVELTPELRNHIEQFDFSIFRAKQPLELINEHAQTRFHLTVFGAPLVERPPVAAPPSTAMPLETAYIEQLYGVIGEKLNIQVNAPADFAHDGPLRTLFDRSRITFYFAEGLKELARDQMADAQFFTTLLDEFSDGLYHYYTAAGATGLQRLLETLKASQALQLGGHVLAPHVLAKDREGMCHQLANESRLSWCP